MTLPIEVKGYDTDGMIYCCFNDVLQVVSVHDISERWLTLVAGPDDYTGIPDRIVLAANSAGQLDRKQPCPETP